MQAHALCLFGGAILDIYWVYQSCQDPAVRAQKWRQNIKDLDFVAPRVLRWTRLLGKWIHLSLFPPAEWTISILIE